MTDARVETDELLHRHQADCWGLRRVAIAAAFGATVSGIGRLLDFWPLGASGSPWSVLRSFLDLSQVLWVLLAAGMLLAFLLAAALAAWHRRFRQAASNLIAAAAIPMCLVIVVVVPWSDPWLWYAVANKGHLAGVAARGQSPDQPGYAILEVRDVSTGFAGLNANHFVALIYDETGAVGLAPSARPAVWQSRSLWPQVGMVTVPRGEKLYGHVFKVDVFE